MSLLPAPTRHDHGDALPRFVAIATTMLDPATTEPQRLRLERELLSHLPTVHALGVFDLFRVRHPALRALVEDELATLERATVSDT